jgi:hypothetical protein
VADGMMILGAGQLQHDGRDIESASINLARNGPWWEEKGVRLGAEGELLGYLKEPKTHHELCVITGWPTSTMSHRLGILRASGHIRKSHDGQGAKYELA